VNTIFLISLLVAILSFAVWAVARDTRKRAKESDLNAAEFCRQEARSWLRALSWLKGPDRSKKLETWEKGWIVVCVVVLFGLVGWSAVIEGRRALHAIAFEDVFVAPFENPVCAPLLKAPVEQLPPIKTLVDRESPCVVVVYHRLWLHNRGKPSEVSAEQVRMGRWTLVKPYVRRMAEDAVAALVFTAVFSSLLYGAGLVATRLWRRRRARAASRSEST